MDVASLLSSMPLADLLGIEVVEATDGYAKAILPLREEHSSVPGRIVAHGGIPYALADTAGGAAVISLHNTPTPTVDMRIDYFTPATDDLRAEAEVLRDGAQVAVVDVAVTSQERRIARARGVYKTGDTGDGGAWGVGDPSDFK